MEFDDDERWAQVEGFPGYEVSDRARVRSWLKMRVRQREIADSPRLIKPYIAGANYHYVKLSGPDGRKVGMSLHRLVLETFHGPCPAGMECRHLDGDRLNNNLGNLARGTHTQNIRDKYEHGTIRLPGPPEMPETVFASDFVPVEALIPREVWKSWPGSGDYRVSSHGRVSTRNKRGGKWNPDSRRNRGKATPPEAWRLMPEVAGTWGHRRVSLWIDGKEVGGLVHRLVLETFVSSPGPGQVCRHMDGNPANNRISNLCWGTHTQNMRDKGRHGTMPVGTKNVRAKLTDDQVVEIRRRWAEGESGYKIAADFGTPQTNVSSIVRRKTWKHI